MNNTDILLKYVNTVKETADPSLFEVMKPCSSDMIANHMKQTVAAISNSKRKKFRFEIITGQYPTSFKHYYIDEDKQEHIEDCLVNISVKTTKEKPLSFDEKLNLLANFIKTNKKEPAPGDIFNGFDVGKFYQSALVNKNKYEQVENVVENLL